MSVLRFEIDKPQVIALKFAQGKLKPSTLPDRADDMMYTLVTGETVYLPVDVDERIRAAGIGARTPFTVCRRRGGHYDLATHNDKAAGFVENPAASSFSKSDQAFTPRLNPNTNHFEVPVRPVPQAPPPWPVHTPAQQAVIERKTAAPAPATSLSPLAARYLSAFAVAFEIAAHLEGVIEQRGLPLNFTKEEHIRCLATSIFIDRSHV